MKQNRRRDDTTTTDQTTYQHLSTPINTRRNRPQRPLRTTSAERKRKIPTLFFTRLTTPYSQFCLDRTDPTWPCSLVVSPAVADVPTTPRAAPVEWVKSLPVPASPPVPHVYPNSMELLSDKGRSELGRGCGNERWGAAVA